VPHGVLLNVGLPMLIVAWPIFWISLVPVVAIEAFLARSALGLDTKAAFALSARVNLISTLIGVPLTWVALLAIEMLAGMSFNALHLDGPLWNAVYFVFLAPWIYGTEDSDLVYLAFLILLIPFCIMSIFVESKIASRRLTQHSRGRIVAWARLSNLATYFLIAVCVGIYKIISDHGGV
jgi:hypothetical protein